MKLTWENNSGILPGMSGEQAFSWLRLESGPEWSSVRTGGPPGHSRQRSRAVDADKRSLPE